jgi:hypothetical protein
VSEAPAQLQTATATESSKGPIQVFNDRELATVLHALRLIQESSDGPQDCTFFMCDHFAEAEALNNAEIDVLCERLNLAPEAATKRKVLIQVEGGVAEVLECPDDVDVTIDDKDAQEEPAECNGDGCKTKVYPEDPYFATPCGTYCTDHMREHVKGCEICRNEFPAEAENHEREAYDPHECKRCGRNLDDDMTEDQRNGPPCPECGAGKEPEAPDQPDGQEMSQDQLKAYLENNGFQCPFCGSNALDAAGEHSHSENMIYQSVTCPKCKAEWTDEYTLTGVTEVEPGERGHRNNPDFCAKCGGVCLYDSDGNLKPTHGAAV